MRLRAIPIVIENIRAKQPFGVEVWIPNQVQHDIVKVSRLKGTSVAAHGHPTTTLTTIGAEGGRRSRGELFRVKGQFPSNLHLFFV
jgi:hypothetical protein